MRFASALLGAVLLLFGETACTTPEASSEQSQNDASPPPSVSTNQPGAEQQRSFSSFMTGFYPAWRGQNWSQILAIGKGRTDADDAFQRLISGALAFAQPGMRDGAADWSQGENLNSGQMADIAVTLLAAKDGASKLQAASLSAEQRSVVEHLWKVLYETSVALLGPPGVNLSSTTITEARDKLGSAKHVAQLLSDRQRTGWVTLGEAWLEQQTGNPKAATDLRSRATKTVGADLPWPPIKNRGNNELYVPSP
jgi:hypothetical protein